jgi:hypothetical protein
MKKLVFTLLLSIASIYVWAQETQDNEQSTQKTTTSMPETKHDEQKDHSDRLKTMPVKPPNYGSLVIDWGFNFLRSYPAAMNLNYWGSRFASASFCYNIRLGHTPFVISPGIGISFDDYQFKDENIVLARDETSRNTVLKKSSALFPKSTSRVRSSFDMRYLDLMLEARFNANNKYPKESFFVALGGKLGWLWRASTTVEYEEDDATKRQDNIENFNLNRIRGGFYAKLGWGRFGLCYAHMLSDLFQQDKGPDDSTKTQSLALSVDLF